MSKYIILKNRSLTIETSFDEKIPTKILGVVVIDGMHSTKFVADENGKAKVKEGDKEVDILSYAHKRKRDFYTDLLKNKYNEIENLVILTGAGSSVGIGQDRHKGLTMLGLWDAMVEEQPDHLTALLKLTGCLQKEGKLKEYIPKDLEILLSKANMTNLVKPSDPLRKAIAETRKFIASKCTLLLPDQCPHVTFLNKVILRPQKYPRVKLFTLNYDTLFEQAAKVEKFTVMDGFTFSNPRVFNGKYFDYDIIETRHNRQDKNDSSISKLFYLFKMHGSLNWKRSDHDIEQYDGDINDEDRVMIFPQDSKYEHSYEQPYFEMMARFQTALRKENTLLITIGFSFFDKHISSVILESLKQNPSLNVITFTYPFEVPNEKVNQKDLHKISEMQSRVTLVAESFEDLSIYYPENVAHKRIDILEELNERLKHIPVNGHTNES